MWRMVSILLGVSQMANGQSVISRANAEHYTWGQGCDGWYQRRSDDHHRRENAAGNW
jgi:hypothetical protein